MVLQHHASHFDVDNIHQLVVVNHHPCYGISDITGTLSYLDIYVPTSGLVCFFPHFFYFSLNPMKKTNIAGIANALQRHSFTAIKPKPLTTDV